MNNLITLEKFKLVAKYYLFKLGIIDGDGEITNQAKFQFEYVRYCGMVNAYTLTSEEVLNLESYAWRKNIHIEFGIDDELMKDINGVIATDHSRASYDIDGTQTFTYYMLAGDVWVKLREIIDKMRADKFNRHKGL